MPFKKGDPKPAKSGRRPGVVNKLTLRIEERLAVDDFDVMGEMIALCRRTDNEMVLAKILTHISDKIFPARTAVKHSGEINNPYAGKSLEELEVLVRERLEE